MVVDSSVWLEIFLGGPLGEKCEREIAKAHVLVPSLVYFEVYKCLRKKATDHQALLAIGKMASYETVELTQEVAVLAADLSIALGIGMADSLVLAHARQRQVPLLTLDNDFAEVPGVKVLR